jgi:hypothetical protein
LFNVDSFSHCRAAGAPPRGIAGSLGQPPSGTRPATTQGG